MRLLALLAVGLFAGSLLAADDKKENPKKVRDEEAILGTWKVEKMDSGTEKSPLPPEAVEKIRFTFAKDGKLTAEGMGPKEPIVGEFKLDSTAKPKLLDLILNEATMPAAYDLSGDTLKICCQLGVPDGEKFTRPEEVKADPKKGVAVFVFKRVKDEKKDK